MASSTPAFHGLPLPMCVALALLLGGALTPTLAQGSAGSSMPTLDSYQNSAELVEGTFYLYWTVDSAASTIAMAVKARTAGWVALGISEVGAMVGSDVMLGWVADGSAVITDRFIFNKSAEGVALDQSQDVRIVAGQESVNASTGEIWTCLHFWRALNTSDCNDRAILPGEHVPLIWAMGSTDEVAYHGATKGVSVVTLVAGALFGQYGPAPELQGGPQGGTVSKAEGAAAAAADPSKLMGFKERQDASGGSQLTSQSAASVVVSKDWINVTNTQYHVPTNYTTYACNGFELQLSQKAHVVEFGAILNGTSTAALHHIVLWSCLASEAPRAGPNYECLATTGCSLAFAIWALGLRPVQLPAVTGLPVGGNSFTRFVLQIHYTNPEGRADIVDSSGMYLRLSPALRKYDAGFLETGPGDYHHMIRIPPGKPAWTQDTYCPSACTDRLADTSEGLGTNITIFASCLHLHTLGKQLYTDVYRNGSKLLTIERADYYDFQYQQCMSLDPGFYLQPGDELRTRCVWDSSKATQVTAGGEGSNNEMCVNFLLYYPARHVFQGMCFNFCQPVSNTSSKMQAYAVCGTSTSGQASVNGSTASPINLIKLNDTCPAPADMFGSSSIPFDTVAGCPGKLAPSLSALDMSSLAVPSTGASTSNSAAALGGVDFLASFLSFVVLGISFI